MARHDQQQKSAPSRAQAPAETPAPSTFERNHSEPPDLEQITEIEGGKHEPLLGDAAIIDRALRSPAATPEDLRDLEAGRDAAARAFEAINARIDGMKSVVASVREEIQILAPRQYLAAGGVSFNAPAGAVYRKAERPTHFAAIVARGRVGRDFKFLTPKAPAAEKAA